MSERVNVSDQLSNAATLAADRPAVIALSGRTGMSESRITFGELENRVDAFARGLVSYGVSPGDRLVLLVPCGIDFVVAVHAALRSGATLVLIDPGMGIRRAVSCLEAVEPAGFLAVPKGQFVRLLWRRRFQAARFNVTIGSELGWGGISAGATK